MSAGARGTGTPRTRSRWFRLVWILPLVLVIAAAGVLFARWLCTLPAVADFLAAYPGQSTLPAWAPVGIPAWLQWQHFLTALLLVFIVRTGMQVHSGRRPDAYWTRDGRLGFIPGQPVRIPLHVWTHLTANALWVLNGLVFYVLLFSTGQWVRIVPTSWDVFPNAISAGLQYASLDWPTENGWVNYNALQLLTYFFTVFIAAPLAVLSGLRTVPGLANAWRPLDRVFPVAWARRVHYPVFLYFLVFTAVHVFLVFATGALRNLNHMYGGGDEESWFGFVVFGISLAVMVLAWFAVQPTVTATLARATGRVGR